MMRVPALLIDNVLEDNTRVYNLSRAETGEVTVIRFRCPYGCGTYIRLPLQGPNKWSLVQENPPSITPSIQRLNGCNSHMFLTNGEWVIDNK